MKQLKFDNVAYANGNGPGNSKNKTYLVTSVIVSKQFYATMATFCVVILFFFATPMTKRAQAVTSLLFCALFWDTPSENITGR